MVQFWSQNIGRNYIHFLRKSNLAKMFLIITDWGSRFSLLIFYYSFWIDDDKNTPGQNRKLAFQDCSYSVIFLLIYFLKIIKYFYMFPVFYKTFWLYLLDKQTLQIHHNNNYLLFDVNNHQDFFLFHCILFQTFSNRYYHFQYFCWAAHNLWREKIDLVSDKSSSYNMIINIHSKSKYFTKLI